MTKPKVYPIPTIWYNNRGEKFMTQERGEKCYVVRRLDDFRFQYMVLERVVRSIPTGFVETLLEYQRYERFLTMDAAESHFRKVEAGEAPLMLGIHTSSSTSIA